jgi:hypothetical protein
MKTEGPGAAISRIMRENAASKWAASVCRPKVPWPTGRAGMSQTLARGKLNRSFFIKTIDHFLDLQ